MFREATRRVGRPGIFLQSVGTAETDTAQIAASNPIWGERLSDGRFVPSIAELNRLLEFKQDGPLSPVRVLYSAPCMVNIAEGRKARL